MRKQIKGSRSLRDGEQFLALPHVVIDSKAYRSLSVYARALLVDIGRQYMGNNNGQLLCSRKKMEELGWKSHDTLMKARDELLAARFLHQTVMGARPNKASWYALTWLPLAPSNGYDAGTAALFVRGAYRDPLRVAAVESRAQSATQKTQSLARHAGQVAA